MYRVFLNFAKSCISSCFSKFYNKKNFTVPLLKYKCLKLKLSVFLAGHSVAMAMGNLLCHENNTNVSPMIGQFFDTMIVASTYKEWQ